MVDVKLGEFLFPHISRFKESFAKRQKGNEAVFWQNSQFILYVCANYIFVALNMLFSYICFPIFLSFD
jgi:hypothetical protein